MGKYEEILKREGLKNTKHRNSILEVIETNIQPMTAEEIFLQLKDKYININISSVYRILDVLTLKGLIIKNNIAGVKKALYEKNEMVHKHYFVCNDCKKMIAIEGCPLEKYEEELHKETGFDITGHKLEIFGYCKDCKSK
jgi:Fur family ferric uptake transcriptional regulator